MHIAILVPMFPNMVQTYIVSTIVGLKQLGHKTTIIAKKCGEYTSLPPAVSEHQLLSDTIYINTDGFRLAKNLFHLPLLNKKYWRILLKLFSSNIRESFGLRYFLKSLVYGKILATKNIDIIHSHSFFTSYDYIFIKEVFDIPIVATFHGHIPKGVKKLSPEKVEKVLFWVDTFFVNTPFSKQQLLDMGCAEDKIKIIPQGTDISAFPYTQKIISDKNIIRILTVGRLSIEKGHAVALHAIALLANEYANIEYHIVGDGPERENITSLIKELHLDDKVTLHGLLASEDLNELYSNSHIFILPSIDLHDGFHVETQGVVLQEAQSSGLAVIASRTGGIPDIIKDQETGLLFDEGNEIDLAEAIKHLILNPKQFDHLCLNGRKDVETRFDINVICDSLASTYKENINQS